MFTGLRWLHGPALTDDAPEHDAEIARLDALAKQRDLETSIAKGNEVELSVYRRERDSALSNVRQGLLALPSKTVPMLHGMPEAGRVSLIRQTIEDALHNFDHEMPEHVAGRHI